MGNESVPWESALASAVGSGMMFVCEVSPVVVVSIAIGH